MEISHAILLRVQEKFDSQLVLVKALWEQISDAGDVTQLKVLNITYHKNNHKLLKLLLQRFSAKTLAKTDTLMLMNGNQCSIWVLKL